MLLVDAGPLVAPLDRSDPHHARCRDALKTARDPLATVWPAFTEAMYLLRSFARAQRGLRDMVAAGGVTLLSLAIDDFPRIRELIWKYRDLQMDLADASLVRVAEGERLKRVFTLDRRDFQIYRPMGVGRFELLP